MIWIKRIVFILFVLITLVAGMAAFIIWRYADDLKAYALDAVHSTIVTDVSFSDEVVLSLWKDFPHVAVELSDIQIEDAFRTDTLLKIEKAFVQFDLIKLLQNQFTIEGIRVSNGFLRLRRNDQDKWNYRVWKNLDGNAAQQTDFNIEILTLENIHLDHDDRLTDMNIQFLSEKSRLKGRFTDDNTRLGLSLNGFLERLILDGEDRVVELPVNLSGVLNINSHDGIFTIEMGNAILAGNEMVLNAQWTRADSGTHMEMKANASDIDPFGLLPHIWPQMPDNIRNLKLEGRADLIFSLSGPINRAEGPELNATIRLRDGGLLFQETNVSDLNFEGKIFMKDIRRSTAMEITFDSFSLTTPKGQVKGKGTLTDLSDPRLKLTTSGTSRLEELISVARIGDEMSGTGNISWNIDFEGPLGKDFNTTVKELKQMTWSGSVKLSQAELKFTKGVPMLKDLNADIEMAAGNTVIRNCSGQIGHLQFDGEVEMARLKEVLTDAQAKIELTGTVHIAELYIQTLPSEWQFNPTSTSAQTASRPVSIQVNSTIDRIIYNDFTATEVAGRIRLENEKLEVTGLKFNALDGTVAADLNYVPTPYGSQLGLRSQLRNIDMTRALSEWDNFGQTTITAKNLKGRASATLDAEIHLDKADQLLKNRLVVEADLEISGGELVQFEPLLAMSKFISVDELNHVKFDTIRNRFSIRDSKLFIPKMSVSSNILNVQVFGEHGFDQEMDYHVNLLLNDLLRRKAKKVQTFEGHEIIDDKGKTRLFLWVRGRPGSMKVGFDKKEVRQKLKEDFKTEGQTLKQLFKDEFSGKERKTEDPAAVQFKLEEDNSNGKQPLNNAEKPKPDDRPKKKKGLFSKKPETEDTEGGFEIEFEP